MDPLTCSFLWTHMAFFLISFCTNVLSRAERRQWKLRDEPVPSRLQFWYNKSDEGMEARQHRTDGYDEEGTFHA